jgi:hypothetical protein
MREALAWIGVNFGLSRPLSESLVMAAKSRGDFNIARAWFWFSAIAATIYATVQLMPLEMTLAWRVFLVALAWALIGACLTYGLAWGRSERARGRNVKADRCRETFVRRDKAHIHDEDPRQLLSLYQGRTALQGDKLIQPYKGTWIEFQGVLDHVTPEADSSLRYSALMAHPSIADLGMTGMQPCNVSIKAM